jgi:uncharacterized protein
MAGHHHPGQGWATPNPLGQLCPAPHTGCLAHAPTALEPAVHDPLGGDGDGLGLPNTPKSNLRSTAQGRGVLTDTVLYIQNSVIISSMERIFEWDEPKAEANRHKHGICFEEAARVFDDPLAWSQQDRIENAQHRWQTIGMVNGCLVILVAHTLCFEEDNVELVRIISARRASRQERKRYEHR